jgi:outer membrane protein assembly factor BamB
MVAFDVDTFTETAAWPATTKGFGGGMWQGSQGPAADAEGNVYAVTGNGGFIEGDNGHVRDFVGDGDFPEAVVRLTYRKTGAAKGKLALDDWFIPFRDAERHPGNYNYRDQDLSAAGPVLAADNDLLLAGGKDGILYVLDRHKFGKTICSIGSCDLGALKSPPIYVTYNGVGLPATGNIDFPLGDPARNPSKTHHLHGSPVYWNGANGPMVFVWGENESLRAWRLDPETGKLSFVGKSLEVASARLAAQATGIGGMPGGMLTVSSNGKTADTGIVWALAPIDEDANHDVVEGIARAYDATALAATPIDPQTPRLKLLWDSKEAGMTFKYAKFCPPVVADGRLFVPTYEGRVDMYMTAP